jgi:type IV pilus assembly protein PilZ
MLSLAIKDKNALYAAYMSFVTNGGLFIPTNRQYEMGQEVFMLLHLMEEVDRLPIAGKVIWKTPPGSESYHATGVGIQFTGDEGGIAANNKIQTYLAGALKSSRPTHTM